MHFGVLGQRVSRDDEEALFVPLQGRAVARPVRDVVADRRVVFEPDGIPRVFTTNGTSCTELGPRGEGGGGIYVTNGRRDYAIVLSPLGTARAVGWNPSSASWMD